MAIEILNFLANVALILLLIAITLYFLSGFAQNVYEMGEDYIRLKKLWYEREEKLIDLEYAVKEIKEKVAKND